MPEPDMKLAATLKKVADEMDRLLQAREKLKQAHKLKMEKILKEGLKDLDPGLRDSATRVFGAHTFSPLPTPPIKPPKRPIKKHR